MAEMNYHEMVAKAKELGYTGSTKKADVEKFLAGLEPSNEPCNEYGLSELETSSTFDKYNRNILELSTNILDKIWSTMLAKRPSEMKFFLDQDELGIKNFDLPISIMNILAFYEETPICDELVEEVKEVIYNEFGLSIYQWLDRWLVIERLAAKMNLQVFSFDMLSDIHDEVMRLWIPYEITLWISDEMIQEYFATNELVKEKYPMGISKSFVWYNQNTSDILKIFNTYWKRLDKNSFEVLKPLELFKNFNLSSKGYVFFPKRLLSEDDMNFIKLNQGLSTLAQSAMRRGMWDWKDPQWLVTKDWIVWYILHLKQKHKLK